MTRPAISVRCYILLNSVTRIIAQPVPCCDEAVSISFGGSQWKWPVGALSGYHQIRVDKASQHELAFTGPNSTKYTYNVMLFGPVNGPPIFIIFIHDMNQRWQEVATSRGIAIDAATNTKIITDDIFSWAPTFKLALKYLRCQLEVCRAQNLTSA